MNIFVIPIEPIDSRYTKQWYNNIPLLIKEYAEENNHDVDDIISIGGYEADNDTTDGAFLNFVFTNIWKSDQTRKVAELFQNGTVKPNDVFLVTDTWNFSIIAIKYMSELLDIPVKIAGIWHAGHYDPSDILGMKMSPQWPKHFERSLYYSCDYNFYGTDFHKNMFLKNLDIPSFDQHKAIRSGQPHEYVVDELVEYDCSSKHNIIAWPHRYNADKQPEIAEDLSDDYDVMITQKLSLTKPEYYARLAECKVFFSCALHENLGISAMEAVFLKAIPILPDRCSYKEMYEPEFLYPSEYTESWDSYKQHKTKLMMFINERMNNYEYYLPALDRQMVRLRDDYMNANIMLETIFNGR